jgi:hypothetical protein
MFSGMLEVLLLLGPIQTLKELSMHTQVFHVEREQIFKESSLHKMELLLCLQIIFQTALKF